MTVETTTSRAQYATNGTTGPWTVNFYFLEDEHLQVIHTDSAGNETVLALGAGYSVTGAGDENGGTVTTTTAYGAGGYITILRSVEPLQETDLVDGDSLPAETLETALDKLTMLAQQALEVVGRALVFSPSDTSGSTLPAAPARADKLLSFDSNGAVSLVAPAAGTATALALSLASSANATSGAWLIGFDYSRAYALGTFGRWVKDRLSISVKDFGATGDGITDDSAAITAACAALSPGKTLYFPPGTYLVAATVLDAAVVLPVDCNMFMERGAWLKKSDAGGSILAPLGRNVLQVNIDGGGYPLIGGVAGTWTIENAGIRAYFDPSIGLGATDVVIVNSEIKNCTYGVQANGSQRWRISNSKIHRIKFTGVLMGFYASYDCAYNVIGRNHFEDLGDYAVAFYQVGGEAAGFGVYNTVENNTAKDCNQRTSGYAYGVEQGDPAYQSNFLFIGNQYIDTVSSGTYGHGGIVISSCTNSAVVGNVLTGSLGSNVDAGVSAFLSVNCLIEGNVVTRFRGHAVFADGSTDLSIRANQFKDCGDASTSYAALMLALNETTTGTTVQGNTLTWSDAYAHTGAGAVAIGAVVATGKTVSRLSITDNRIHNAPRTGVYVLGLSGNTASTIDIARNTMTGDALFLASGLLLEYCSTLTITDNIIRDAGSASSVANSTGVVARGNVGYVTESQGLTTAISTGATVSHGLIATPNFVNVTAAETGPTDITVSAVGATTFVINFGGGGSKTFYWRAEV